MSERKTVEGAYAKIESHEKDCARRYESLESGITDLKDTVKGARNGAWLIGIGVIGWLLVQLYGQVLNPPQPAAVAAVAAVADVAQVAQVAPTPR